MLKSRRSALLLGERREKSYRITCRLAELLAPWSVVLAYVSKEPEVESMVIINSLLAEGKTVCVPIIERETHTLRLSYLSSVEHLEPGTFSVPEPLSTERPAAPEEVEVVLLPLLGFDRQGNRLGYGAGYYDRFLAAYSRPVKIGLAYACQECESLPAETTDVSMDYVVTEEEVIVCKK